MGKPFDIHHQGGNHMSSSSSGANPNSGRGNSGPESYVPPLKHNPGISKDWSPEEQAILEDGLAKYAAESSIVCYAKIAMQLQEKTVRDIAMRCRWMNKKEHSKRRKEENLTRKGKDKKERVDPSAEASFSMANPNVPPYATPKTPVEYDDGISPKAIGGTAGELLEQNAKALEQISANLSKMKLKENIGLLGKTRKNLLKLMKELDDGPDIMKQMPPLPVKLNEEMANAILSRQNVPKKKK